MLARLAAWSIVPVILAVTIAFLGMKHDTYLMGDFRAFYCGGAAVAQHADPYLEEPLHGCERAAGPPSEPSFMRGIALPAPLPPYALALFVPFSFLPFTAAAALFGTLLLIANALAVALYARLTGASSILLNLVFAAISATVTLYIGQPIPLVMLALAAAALLVRRERWWPAALCCTAATIEPHVAAAAFVALFVALPRMRIPLAASAAGAVALGVAAVGPAVALAYVRDVVPAHALANAYEWQFSLTSVLTSAGVAAPLAIRSGELMLAAMIACGVAIGYRFWKRTGDAAVLVLVPPAFAVFGGVHVHFQQLALAFPAFLYVWVRYPRVRTLAATGLALAMIPWNVMSSSPLAGLSPILVGTFSGITLGRTRGLVLACVAAGIGLSLLALVLLGFGPPHVDFVAVPHPASALAEESWGEFSRATMMRPSLLMQWLRVPTVVGLACGLAALIRAAYPPPAPAHMAGA
ncbi:MAG TPA: glycosyltransferase family 87 protein [Candidatus Elarobacter sp.]